MLVHAGHAGNPTHAPSAARYASNVGIGGIDPVFQVVRADKSECEAFHQLLRVDTVVGSVPELEPVLYPVPPLLTAKFPERRSWRADALHRTMNRTTKNMCSRLVSPRRRNCMPAGTARVARA